MAQIAKIRELTAGWCGPRSSPISAGVIDRTLDILAGIYTPAVRAPHLAPMACDAIIVEWNTQGLGVSIEVAVASWPIAVDVYNPTDDQGLTVFCHTIEEIRAALPFREESYKKKIDDNNQHGVTRMTDLTTDERNTILHTLGLTPVNGKMPRWSQRNYYIGESVVCASLAQQGHMRRYAEPRKWLPYPLYCVTAAGVIAAGVGNRVRKEDMVGKQ